MKNFQQTPKQRRVDMAKQKQRIQASKPVIQFEQVHPGKLDWYGQPVHAKNRTHHINGRR